MFTLITFTLLRPLLGGKQPVGRPVAALRRLLHHDAEALDAHVQRGHDPEGLRLLSIVTVLGLVGGVPGGETPRVADSSAAGGA